MMMRVPSLFFLVASCVVTLGLGTPISLARLKVAASGGSAPAAPSGLTVTSVDGTGVTLGWTDNSSNEDGFWVEHYNGSGGAVWAVTPNDSDSDVLPTAASDTTHFSGINSSTPTGQQYELSFLKFRVKSTNAFGASAYSAEAQVPPSVVTSDMTAIYQDVLGFDIAFTFTGENYSSYELQVNVNGGGWGAAVTKTATEVDSGAIHIDEGVLPAADAAYAMMQPVLFRGRYVNSGGNGPWSNEATTTDP